MRAVESAVRAGGRAERASHDPDVPRAAAPTPVPTPSLGGGGGGGGAPPRPEDDAPPADEETKEAPETVPLSEASLRVGKVLKLYEDGGNPLRTAFDNWDVSKSGRLTVDELLEGLKGLGAAFENMTKPEVEKVVIDAFGKDPDGATVSYADFVGFVSRARGQLDAAEA